MATLHLEIDIEIPDGISPIEVEMMAQDMDVFEDDSVYNDYIIHMPERPIQLLGDVETAYWEIR